MAPVAFTAVARCVLVPAVASAIRSLPMRRGAPQPGVLPESSLSTRLLARAGAARARGPRVDGRQLGGGRQTGPTLRVLSLRPSSLVLGHRLVPVDAFGTATGCLELIHRAGSRLAARRTRPGGLALPLLLLARGLQRAVPLVAALSGTARDQGCSVSEGTGSQRLRIRCVCVCVEGGRTLRGSMTNSSRPRATLCCSWGSNQSARPSKYGCCSSSAHEGRVSAGRRAAKRGGVGER